MAFYGGVLLMAAVAFSILVQALQAIPDANAALHAAVGANRWKEVASIGAYVVAIASALFISPVVSAAIYTGVAAMWLVPDRRIETVLTREHDGQA